MRNNRQTFTGAEEAYADLALTFPTPDRSEQGILCEATGHPCNLVNQQRPGTEATLIYCAGYPLECERGFPIIPVDSIRTIVH